ncbi:MAG: Uma2 family endonuclease [Polyangiaceae bacterium]
MAKAVASIVGYIFDPLDPRAPSSEIWEKMTPAEREQVVAMLPPQVPAELSPPEGDFHRKAKETAVDALENYFRRVGRKVYISSEIGVYYPGEPRFAPDVLAVLDVDPHERSSWVVTAEDKGLDFVLEVHVSGDFSKDHEKNVERYARLGIGEYFLFDRTRGSLYGYRLPPSGRRAYERIVPQLGRYTSGVLGLDLALIQGKLRFLAGDATLPQTEELLHRLGLMLDDVMSHKDDLERQLAEERAGREAERAAKEAERAAKEAAEAKLAEALALIEKLQKS